MVLCLILHHPTVTTLTKIKLLRMVFYGEDFEIEVHSSETTIIYIWNIEILHVWKAVKSFEIANIKVGYGYGKVKKEAEKLAFLHLNIKENRHRSHSIEQ